MKILQISPQGLGKGGVQKIIMDITENLSDNNKIDVLLSTNEKRFYDDEFQKYGGNIYRINIKNSKSKIVNCIKNYISISYKLLKMYKLFKDNKYDVIHCHNEYESGICVYAAYLAKVPIRIAHFHRTDYGMETKIYYKFYTYLMKKWIEKYSTTIICCCKLTQKSFFKEYNNPKIKVFYNPIELTKFKPIKTRLKEQIVISNVAVYSDNKNQSFLIDVMKQLNLMNYDVRLNLIGYEEEYKKILVKKVMDLNLENIVQFIDGNTDIIKQLSNTDIFAFPSKKEGFSVALLEAQAMNIPCIVSDSITEESNFGLIKYISLNKTPKEWAQEIINIIQIKDELQLNLNRLKELDINNYVSRLEKIYKGENI